MTTLLYANNAITALSAPITTSSTVISVAPSTGSLFPSPTSGQSFRITLTDAATGLIYEILDCTSRSGDSLTVSRAQEGTTAKAWSAGDKVSMFPTAGTMQNLAQNNGYGANGTWNININGSQSGGTISATNVSVSNTLGGGYGTGIHMYNIDAGTPNPNKYLRVGDDGSFSIINSAFTQGILSLTDSGNLIITGSFAASSATINGGVNCNSFRSYGAGIFDGYLTGNGGAKIYGTTTLQNNWTAGILQLYAPDTVTGLGSKFVGIGQNGEFRVVNNAYTTTIFEVSDDGNLSLPVGIGYQPGGGSWGTYSDARLKNNVTPLTGSLDKIKTLNPVTYSWNYDAKGEPTVGFIAQDVEKVFPNAVRNITPTEEQKPFITDNKLFTIGWQNDIFAYLVGAIQELSKTVETQAQQIAALQAKG